MKNFQQRSFNKSAFNCSAFNNSAFNNSVAPQSFRQKVIFSAIGIATSMMSYQVALAEDQSLQTLEEIIVTARRRDENLMDVPIAITAIGAEDLRKQGIEKIEDLGIKVPSLRIHQAGASLNEPLITLRGQRQGEAAFNQDPGVPIYFNEIAVSPAQGSNLSLYDLASVQVLKGPQGTLFGRNSTGGAVLATPQRPGTELGGYAEFKAGNYNLFGFEGAVDIPLSSAVQMRLSARKLDRDGYQTNIADNELKGDDYRDEHSQGLRAGLLVDVDGFNNFTVLAYDESESASAVPVLTGINRSVGLGFAAVVAPTITPWGESVDDNFERDDPWHVKTDLDAEERVENLFFSNTTELELTDDLTLKNVLGYREVVFDSQSDVDGTEYPVFGSVPTEGLLWAAGADWGITRNPLGSEMDTDFVSNELQLVGNAFDQAMDFITGVYYSKLDGSQDRNLQQGPFTYDSGFNDIVNTSYGVFAEGTYRFNDAWAVTFGARQSWDKRELAVHSFTDLARTSCALSGPEGSELSVCERSVDESFSSPTWRISANYTPTDGQLMYASVATGYRAGGFNTRAKDDATLVPFDEETVITYEFGHKADWSLGSVPVRTNLAIYLQDYEDIQNTVSFFEGDSLVTRTENASKAQISGFELDVSAALVEGFSLSAAYSYVDAEFKEREDLISGVVVDTSNNDFTYVPEQTATLTANADIPIDEALGSLSLLVSVYWQSDMSTHPKAEQFDLFLGSTGEPWAEEDVAFAEDFSRQDAYSVWNARIEWRNLLGSQLDLSIFGNNLTDEQYVLGGLNVIESGGYGAYHYGAPRTYGASINYAF